MGTFDDNVGNDNDSDKKLLNGTNGISENVSVRTHPVREILSESNNQRNDYDFVPFFPFQNCDKLNMRHLLTLKRSRPVVQPVYSNRDNLKRYTSDEEDEEDEVDAESQPSSPTLAHKPLADGTSSAAEWIGITTNSEECSYSSADHSESQLEYSENNGCEWNDYATPTVILNSNCAIGDRSE